MKCKLGTLAAVKGGKRLPKGINLISTTNSHPYIRVRDLNDQRTLELNSNYEFVDDETQKQIARYIVQKGDIILSIVGTIGLVAMVGESLDNANLTENCVKIVATEKIDSKFLYYYLKSSKGQAEITRGIVGAVQAKLPIKNIQDIDVWLPRKDIQTKIASLLSCLDDKIELNNKINETLYTQAKTIFDDCFINIDSLPDGWRRGNLLDIANFLNGLAMQKFRPQENEAGLSVLKIKELRQGSCDTSSERCSPSIKPEYIVKDGDVIFSWSGSLLVDIWCGGTCGLNQHLFKVTSDTYDKWFYYMWIAHHLDRFISVAADKATTMGHIKREELAKAEVLIPSKGDYKKVSALMTPMFELIIINRLEARKLAKLRDELLPKLMSGEIDVS
ncbi:MAG: restriction endonuclease subunit S [Christensenellales bacterium]|nr:restriction endonuclease subunit S [Christensenellales bacterium]